MQQGGRLPYTASPKIKFLTHSTKCYDIVLCLLHHVFISSFSFLLQGHRARAIRVTRSGQHGTSYAQTHIRKMRK